MAVLAHTVMSITKSLLNDPTGAMYPDIAMYPLMNKCYRELQNKLTAMGVGVTVEVAAVIPVPVGTTRLGDGAGLPADFVYPIELRERGVGETDDQWRGMAEQIILPRTPSNNLIIWEFREEEIKFAGAKTDREVLLRYYKGHAPIVDSGSVVSVINCDQWLAQRTAAVAALVIGSNPSRASALMGDLSDIWSDLQATLVKGMQNAPTRRRRTRYRV